MKHLLFFIATLVTLGAQAQYNTINTNWLNVKQGIRVKGMAVTRISADTALANASDSALSTQSAVKRYVDSKLTSNIYNTDGHLSYNRVVTGGNWGLRFDSMGHFDVSSNVYPSTDRLYLDQGNAGLLGQSQVVVGTATHNITMSFSEYTLNGLLNSDTNRVLTTGPTGAVTFKTIYPGGGGSTDTANIYNHDGNLTSNRKMNAKQLSLTIDSTSAFTVNTKWGDQFTVGGNINLKSGGGAIAFYSGGTQVMSLTPAIILAQFHNADTNQVLTTNAAGMLSFKSLPVSGSFINNASAYQTAAVFNVDRGLITQADDASTAAQFPSVKASPLIVKGGAGATTSFNSGTVAQGANASDVQIYAGAGGGQTGTAVTTGGGGKGGDVDVRGGAGGLALGGGTSSGNGGNAILQGGDIGTTGTGVNPGIAGYAKVAGGSAPNASKGDGGDVFLIPGQHYVSGYRDGDVMICTSPAAPIVRGRALVGFPAGVVNTDAQMFQVAGTSIFNDTVTMVNTPALGTPANNFLTSNNGIVQTRTAAQVVADIGAAPWYDYISRTAQPSNPPAVPAYTADLNGILNNAVSFVDATAVNNPAGRSGYLYAAGNNSGVTGSKYQIYGGTQNDDFWYRYGTDGGPWGTWYQSASRTWVGANFAPATNIRTITASYTATAADYTIINKATTGTPVLTLPAASANTGKVYNIIEEAGNPTANGIVFSSVTFKGATYTSFNNPTLSAYSRLTVQSDGTDWVVISSM